jgi:hypothetical protein
MKVISRDDYVKCGRLRVWGTFFHALHDHMEDRLAAIAQPVLVVRGEKDPICLLHFLAHVFAGLGALDLACNGGNVRA